MKIGETHSIWNSLDSIVLDVRKGTMKYRMLTCTYMHPSTSHKFCRLNVSATCKCCGLYDEDLAQTYLDAQLSFTTGNLYTHKLRTKILTALVPSIGERCLKIEIAE